MTKKSCSRGWVALAFAFLCAVLVNGMVTNQVSLMLEPMCTDLGISRTAFSTAMSLTPLLNCILSFFYAKFLKTIGLKKMAVLGVGSTLVYLVALYACSIVPSASIVFIGIGSLIMAFANSWVTIMTGSIIITNWFAKRTGTFISMFGVLSSAGSVIFAPFISNMIISSGWESTVLLRAILMVIMLLFTIIALKVAPGQGETKVWADEADSSEAENQAEATGLTFAEAKKTKNFWFALLTTLMFGLFAYPPMIVVAAHASDIGHPEVAGTVMSVLYAVSIIVTIPMGGLIEKYGCRKVLTPYLLIGAASMVVLGMKSASVASILIGAGGIGFLYALLSVPIPMLAGMFGTKDFGRIQSYLFTVMIAGMIVGMPLFNAVFDMVGSYRYVFLANAALLVINIVALFAATSKLKAKDSA